MVPKFGSIKDDLGYTWTKLDLWESLAHLQPNAYITHNFHLSMKNHNPDEYPMTYVLRNCPPWQIGLIKLSTEAGKPQNNFTE